MSYDGPTVRAVLQLLFLAHVADYLLHLPAFYTDRSLVNHDAALVGYMKDILRTFYGLQLQRCRPDWSMINNFSSIGRSPLSSPLPSAVRTASTKPRLNWPTVIILTKSFLDVMSDSFNSASTALKGPVACFPWISRRVHQGHS